MLASNDLIFSYPKMAVINMDSMYLGEWKE